MEDDYSPYVSNVKIDQGFNPYNNQNRLFRAQYVPTGTSKTYTDLEKKTFRKYIEDKKIQAQRDRDVAIIQNTRNRTTGGRFVPLGSDDLLETNPIDMNSQISNEENERYNKPRRSVVTIDSRDRDLDLYPDPNSYKIQFNRQFRNVKSIRLISTEIPNTEQSIKDSPDYLVNNRLYWINDEDASEGDFPYECLIYQANITAGNYTANTIKTKLTEVTGEVLRFSDMQSHDFLVDINLDSDIFAMTQLKQTVLGLDPFSITKGSNVITVTSPAHGLSVGDQVIITGARNFAGISNTILNNTYVIISVTTDTYDIIVSAIGNESISGGGSAVTEGKPNLFAFLFSNTDTPGQIFGFPQQDSSEQIAYEITLVTTAPQDLSILPAPDPVYFAVGAAPAWITSANHQLTVGDKIFIIGMNTLPDINGEQTVTEVIDNDNFEIGIKICLVNNQQVFVSKKLGTVIQVIDATFSNITNILVASNSYITSVGHGLTSGELIFIAYSDTTPDINTIDTVGAIVNADNFELTVDITDATVTGDERYVRTVDDVVHTITVIEATHIGKIIHSSPYGIAPLNVYLYNTDTTPGINSYLYGIMTPNLYSVSSGTFESDTIINTVNSLPVNQSLFEPTSSTVFNIASITPAPSTIIVTKTDHNLPAVAPFPNVFFENLNTTPSTDQLFFTIDSVTPPRTFTISTALTIGIIQEVTSVTTVADVAGSLNNKYFYLNTVNDLYYVWYNASGAGVDPGIGGRIGAMVAIINNDTANTVATNTATVIDALVDFVAPAPGANVISITNVTGGTVTDASDAGGTGFVIAVTTQGVGTATNVQEVTNITTVADIASSLNNTYFYINSVDTSFYVWYNVSGGGVDPGIVGRTGVMVAIIIGDTAATVASATATALDALIDFKVPAPGGSTLTVTCVVGGYVDDATDAGSTGFTFSVTTPGTGDVCAFTNDSSSKLITSIRPKSNGTFTSTAHGIPDLPSTSDIFIANLRDVSPTIALPLFGDVVQAHRYNSNVDQFETNVVIPGPSNVNYIPDGTQVWVYSADVAKTDITDIVRSTNMTIEYTPALVPVLAVANNVFIDMNYTTDQDITGVSTVSNVDTGPDSFEISGKTVVSVGTDGELTTFNITNTTLGVGTAIFTIIGHPYIIGDTIEVLTHGTPALVDMHTVTAVTGTTVTVAYGGVLVGTTGTVRKVVTLNISNSVLDLPNGVTVLTILDHPYAVDDDVQIVTHDTAALVGNWTVVASTTATISITSLAAITGITGTIRFRYLGKFIRTVGSSQPRVINDIEISGTTVTNITATDHLLTDAITPIRVLIQDTETTPDINGVQTISLPAIIVSVDIFQINTIITAVDNQNITLSIDKGVWSRKSLITNVGVPTILSSIGGVTTIETVSRDNTESSVMFPISISTVNNPTIIYASGITFTNGDTVHISGHKYSTPYLQGDYIIDDIIPDVVYNVLSSASPGPVIIITTTGVHTFIANTYVRFSGHTDYLDDNGPFLILSAPAPTPTTFAINIGISTYAGGGAIGTVSGGASFTIPVNVTVAGTDGFVTGPSESIAGHGLNSYTSTSIGADITSIDFGRPAVVTTAGPHNLITNYIITIDGTDSIPTIDGTRTITVTGSTTFTVDVDVIAPGTTGTWEYHDFIKFDSVISVPSINGTTDPYPITKISDTQFSISESLVTWTNKSTARWGSNIITTWFKDHGLIDNDILFVYDAEKLGGTILPSQFNTSHGDKRKNVTTQEEVTTRHNIRKIDDDHYVSLARNYPTVRERGGGYVVCVSSHNHTNEEKAAGLKNHGFDFIQDNRNCNGNLNRVISLEGEPYIYMQSQLLDTLTTSTLNNNVFAKILLSDPPGSLLYNSFVSNAKVFEDPFNLFDEIDINFIRRDGKLFNFNGIDHSFSLEVMEYIDRLKKANLSSRRGTVDRGAISQLGEYESGDKSIQTQVLRSTYTYTDVAKEDNPLQYLNIRRQQNSRFIPEDENGARLNLSETVDSTRGSF